MLLLSGVDSWLSCWRGVLGGGMRCWSWRVVAGWGAWWRDHAWILWSRRLAGGSSVSLPSWRRSLPSWRGFSASGAIAGHRWMGFQGLPGSAWWASGSCVAGAQAAGCGAVRGRRCGDLADALLLVDPDGGGRVLVRWRPWPAPSCAFLLVGSGMWLSSPRQWAKLATCIPHLRSALLRRSSRVSDLAEEKSMFGGC